MVDSMVWSYSSFIVWFHPYRAYGYDGVDVDDSGWV